MTTTPSPKPKILIVGGGFGGIRAAHRLAKHSDIDVTLVTSEDNFTYYPQLYHSATGGARTESALPLTDVLRGLPVKVTRDTISRLDPDQRAVTGTSGTVYQYDQLILALGSVTNYFGIQGLQEFSYNIKTIDGAEKFKFHLHTDLITNKRPDPNYVIVGGGPTGIELAAALGDYLRRITRLHGLPHPEYKIELVEAAPRLLPRSSEAMSARVTKQLQSLGVTVMTGAAVKAETVDALELAGEKLASKTVVWTAGVSNNPLFKEHTALFTLAKNGKVEVDEHLQGRPNVYVIGDNAATQYSGMAQTALADADFAAADIIRVVRGRPRTPYRPKSPISVIPVGAHWAAAQWGPVALYGQLGFALRRAADLIGYADIEPWPTALSEWLRDSRREDDCNICQPGSVAAPTNAA
jgi:NADH dehydrogenase